MPWSSFGGGNVNKSDFPGSSPFRGGKHLQNSLILWEDSSSSMEMGHKIKEEGGIQEMVRKRDRCIYLWCPVFLLVRRR